MTMIWILGVKDPHDHWATSAFAHSLDAVCSSLFPGLGGVVPSMTEEEFASRINRLERKFPSRMIKVSGQYDIKNFSFCFWGMLVPPKILWCPLQRGVERVEWDNSFYCHLNVTGAQNNGRLNYPRTLYHAIAAGVAWEHATPMGAFYNCLRLELHSSLNEANDSYTHTYTCIWLTSPEL